MRLSGTQFASRSEDQVDTRARAAIDLGAESCRVSLLRWQDGRPSIELIHRIPNGPVHVDGTLRWPLDAILAGLEEGLRKAAHAAPEGIASIAVDGWSVDYVRLDKNGEPVGLPFCYRDERTIASKDAADRIALPEWMFHQTGAQPLRINTVYQLLAETGDWSEPLLEQLKLSKEALPPIVPTGTVVGKLQGPLAVLDAFRDTELIVPACHDTASAIAGISTPLNFTAYICSGTWSLVGTLIDTPFTKVEAMKAGFTNQGAAGGGFCFHSNVNGMWILKQCLESWRPNGRPWDLPELIVQAAACDHFPGIVNVDSPSLLLDGDMPARLNEQLRLAGYAEIADHAGNEPIFARVIFESLASRYATAIQSLENMLSSKLNRIHILGGGSLNQLLTCLTADRTGRPVERGNVESSTVGNFAVQLASSDAQGGSLKRDAVHRWAQRLSEPANIEAHVR